MKRPQHMRSDHCPSWVQRGVLAVSGILMIAGLGACQPNGPPALSLDAAKRATASFADQAFVPPPRTIDDILAKVKALRQKPDRPEGDSLRTIAERSPPKGLEGSALGAFPELRASAAVAKC